MISRLPWTLLTVTLFSCGLFTLAVDPGMDQPLESQAALSVSGDAPGEASACCYPGPPPGCRATGPNNPLATSLHRRAQFR